MKLLLIHADCAARGGAEAFAGTIATEARAAGHSIGTLDISGHTAPDGQRHRPWWFLLGALPVLRRILIFRYALVCRAARASALSYDAAIFTFAEGPALGCPAVHLRHAPAVFSTDPAMIRLIGGAGRAPGYVAVRRLVAWLALKLAGPVDGSALIWTNALWTARHILATTGRQAHIIPPPLPVACPVPLVPRDPLRMLMLGRIVRAKRPEEAVALLAKLRAAGISATLDILGRADSAYARSFMARHGNTPGLRILPNADAATKALALAEASVGLHLYRSEHFGIAVAEMIRAGIAPLVFDDGGVVELVPDRRLRFASTDEAYLRLQAIFANPGAAPRLAARLRATPVYALAAAGGNNIAAPLSAFVAGAADLRAPDAR